MPLRLALKIDVDTDRGTRLGVPSPGRRLPRIRRAGLLPLLARARPDRPRHHPHLPAGVLPEGQPDQRGLRCTACAPCSTARCCPRRTSAAATPAVLRAVRDAGFEVGIHCYNHYRWQDHVHTMSLEAVRAEFIAARAEFLRIFGREAHTAGAAGWQSNARSRRSTTRPGCFMPATRGMARPFPRGSAAACSRRSRSPARCRPSTSCSDAASIPTTGSWRTTCRCCARTPSTCSRSTRRSRAWANATCSASFWPPAATAACKFIRLDDLARELLADRDGDSGARPGAGAHRRPLRPRGHAGGLTRTEGFGYARRTQDPERRTPNPGPPRRLNGDPPARRATGPRRGKSGSAARSTGRAATRAGSRASR